jgi:hypothetical protein
VIYYALPGALITLLSFLINIGKLPVDVDMNQIQKGNFDDERTTESPPPIPPKMIEDDESGLPEKSRVHMVAETQASVPALPPKPVNKSVRH